MKKTSAFAISQTNLDNELCRGGSFSQGKPRIHAFYQEQPTMKDAVKFLKNEYGMVDIRIPSWTAAVALPITTRKG